MIILKHELKTGFMSLLVWSCAIGLMLVLCIFLYPEMKDQMTEISKEFAEMGLFSQAFGMDRINFGEFTGYFGVECGNVLGLGGALFASLIATSSLAKEEKEHTAEFLLTTPKTRNKVILGKLLSVYVQIILLNIIVILLSIFSILIINVDINYKTLFLLFLAYFLMQIEIASICFGISAFIKRGSLGIGLGLSCIYYFLNIIANLSSSTKFLKYLNPFGYTDGADIITNSSINIGYLMAGLGFVLIGIVFSFYYYNKKDIS